MLVIRKYYKLQTGEVFQFIVCIRECSCVMCVCSTCNSVNLLYYVHVYNYMHEGTVWKYVWRIKEDSCELSHGEYRLNVRPRNFTLHTCTKVILVYRIMLINMCQSICLVLSCGLTCRVSSTCVWVQHGGMVNVFVLTGCL